MREVALMSAAMMLAVDASRSDVAINKRICASFNAHRYRVVMIERNREVGPSVVVESPVSETHMRDMFKAVDAVLRTHKEVGEYNQTI
jgi:hypothetical protein